MDNEFKRKLAHHISSITGKSSEQVDSLISFVFNTFDGLVEQKQIDDEREWNEKEKQEYLLDGFQRDFAKKLKDMGMEIGKKKVERFWEMMEEFVWKEEEERLEDSMSILESIEVEKEEVGQ
jgi:hypothetical protein